MSVFRWVCRRLIAHHATKTGAALHRVHRIGRAVVRHKATWLCVVTVAGGAGIWGLPATPPVEQRRAGPTASFPPEWGSEQPGEFFALPPMAFAPVPDIPTLPQPPSPEINPQPEQPPQPVVEPPALALLATALAAMWSFRQ